jgi:hypothetical protein
MVKNLLSLVLALFLVVLFAGWSTAATPSGDGIAAVVNGTSIGKDELAREVERIRRKLRNRQPAGDEPESAAVRREALENLVRRELLYQESRNKGVNVSPPEVDREIETLRKSLAGAGVLGKVLGDMNLSEADLRRDLARGMAIRSLIELEVAPRVEVSGREVTEYYYRHLDGFRQPKQGVPGQASAIPFDEVREKVRQKVKQEKVEKELGRYLKRLREKAVIIIH